MSSIKKLVEIGGISLEAKRISWQLEVVSFSIRRAPANLDSFADAVNFKS